MTVKIVSYVHRKIRGFLAAMVLWVLVKLIW